MSFIPPQVPPSLDASAFTDSLNPGSPNQQFQNLNSSFQNLSVNNTPKTKKKRSARAYHTDLTSAPISNSASPAPPQYIPPIHQSLSQAHVDPYTPVNSTFPNDVAYNVSPYTPGQPAYPPTPTAHVGSGLGVANGFTSTNGVGINPAGATPNATAATINANGYDGANDLSLSNARYLNQLEYNTVFDPENPAYNSFLTFHNVVPPLAGTQFHVIDQGSASSKFIRPTMYNVPENEQLRAATKLPVAVTVRPFAPLLLTEEPIPVVDMSKLGAPESSDPMDIGPPRCRRCRTYMNPFMQHSNHNTFVCNICQFPNNTVPMDYTSMLNPSNNQRIDRDIRPELHKGTYDIIVPKQYNVGGPATENNEIHHIFLIDVSEQSVKHLLPTLVADAIRATIYNLDSYDEEDNQDDQISQKKTFQGRFALITFDKRLQFYNLSPSLDSTQITVSADLEDPFIPFHDGLFADPEESRLAIEDALNHLESLSNDDTFAEPEPCFAAACRYAISCLEGVGGGKITSVLSTLPSWGPGSLKYKDNRAVGRTPSPEVEERIFLPDNEYYKLLAKDFIAQNIGLDVLVVSPLAVDLSNIGWLSSVTGGSVFKMSNFNFERDGRNFTSKFINSVRKTTGYQGQFKLRCSNGLQVSQYYGTSSSVSELSVVGSSVPDPIIPTLNEDQTFTILLQYDGSLNTKFDCHFQAAFLYTDNQGIRKVRVINLVLAVSERLEDVFRFVDQDSVVTTIVRDTLSFIGKQPLTDLRDSVNEKLVDIYAHYRVLSEYGHNRNRTLSKQLIFPESLKHLALYMLAFIKTKAIKESGSIQADTRLNEIFQLLTMPIERLAYKLYPALIELHSLGDDEGLIPHGPENPHKFLNLPKFKELSVQQLQFGVYILCDGDNVYVWIHQNANVLLIKDLFGEEIETVQDINPLLDELPELPTDISQQARNLVEYFQTHIIGSASVGKGSIIVIREGIDKSEETFKELLVEDRSRGAIAASSGPSYTDYITSLHKAIKIKLDNDKSSHKVRDSVSAAEHHPDTLAQRYIQF